MGMTIEKLVAENDRLNRQLAYEATALTMMKADYENRLKADLKAILVELQLEIEEMENPYTTRVSGCAQGGFERGARESQNLIQQKINSLKEA